MKWLAASTLAVHRVTGGIFRLANTGGTAASAIQGVLRCRITVEEDYCDNGFSTIRIVI